MCSDAQFYPSLLSKHFKGSFGNHDGDAEDNVDLKKNFYDFTYESRGILKSFTMFFSVKAITN